MLKLLTLKKALLTLVIFTALGLILWMYYTSRSTGYHSVSDGRIQSPWTWECRKQLCVRELRSQDVPATPLVSCEMACGLMPLWPEPTGTVRLSNRSTTFHPSQLAFQVMGEVAPSVRLSLFHAASIFRANLLALMPAGAQSQRQSNVHQISVSLVVRGARVHQDEYPSLDTDESYRLGVTHVWPRLEVRVYGTSFFGVRHGLETLAQLVWWDGSALRVLDGALVMDRPRFAYRGIMVDTARNFFPLAALRTTIDAMAACKLNVFHWHLSDSHSFPFDSPRQPNMSLYGAYSRAEVYSASDVAAFVEYARVRGVRVLPEVDTPAHAGNGWQWGEAAGLGKLSLCVNRQPWAQFCGQPPCGQLNPENEHTYRVLGDIYRDLVELTHTTDVFHIGGDEVNENCWWQEMGNITDGYDSFIKVWSSFQERALGKLSEALGGEEPRSVIVWSSELTRTETLDPDKYVVQCWGGSTWAETTALLSAGYRIIVSHVDAWYLDCGLGDYRSAGEGPCSPMATWQRVYLHRPWDEIPASQRQLVLGGEACLWTERSDAHSLDERLWPRAAALAERLWSDPATTNEGDGLKEAHQRISRLRERLLTLGVRADAVLPRWCHLNPSMCF